KLEYKTPAGKIVFRPHFGYGHTGENYISHYGVRILLAAGDNKRYGIEVTKLEEVFAIGIVLEQRLFEWFNIVDRSNVIGLTSNLGWEPNNHIPFKPFVTYRSDTIFADNIETINSISIGFNIEF
ncbi:hypothetical protein M1M97_03975, partial [Thermodesulfovibrionales bacterium]|nr:hypothetical protein [Thermodesulfovibrionales bacterium]